ncbi:MAG: pantetheine-phosphate adenylyltransferase [Bdellovibrionales bacterium]|nr:pantetheine-phosphate adenylyltransferase [Bdellovibrionales bacterium]
MTENYRGPVVFPGSFDPLTNGHVDVVSRALNIFDSLIVAVLNNSDKSSLFTVPERVSIIEEEFASWGGRVQVQSFSGLLVDFLKGVDSRVVLRGLRAVSDYDYEAQMALMNKNLSDHVETVFLVTQESHSYISSSLVKQVSKLGGDVSRMVPPSTLRALRHKLNGAN